MDPSTNFSLTQLIIVWTLLGLLLIWMVVFAVLALRSHSRESWVQEDVPIPSRPRLRISSLVPKLHMITSSPRQANEAVNAESTSASKVVARS